MLKTLSDNGDGDASTLLGELSSDDKIRNYLFESDMIKHGRGVEAADPARGYGWIKLAAIRGDDLAKANLQDPLFTPSVRAAGLAQLAYIQSRLLTVPTDSQAILRDPWY
jgi:hypothetical protein